MSNIDGEDIDFWDIKMVVNYIILNYKKFLLLLLVIIIIYVVDYISNLNNIIYGATSVIPGIITLVTPNEIKKPNNRIKKRR